MTKVAFLHTLNANINLFTPYVKQYLPNIEITHFVNEGLLKNAMQFGIEHVRQDVDKMINDIANSDAEFIICSCSTIGALAEEVKVSPNVTVLRVDRPMAEATVSHSRILVLAAVESTFNPTLTLLKSVSNNRKLSIHTQLIEGVWEHYEAGNTEAYTQSIAIYIAKLTSSFSKNQYDAIMLSQASMAPALNYLKTTSKLPLYSSPEICLQYLQNRIINNE